MRNQLVGLAGLLAVCVAANMFLYWVVICRELYKHGARFPTGLLPWRVFRDLRRFKQVRLAKARPLSVYYVTFILSWFNLFLALGTALRALWEQTHPMNY